MENAAQKADTANTNAAGALSTAEAAKLLSAAASKTAEGAQLTADGKNTVFYQTTAPLADGRKLMIYGLIQQIQIRCITLMVQAGCYVSLEQMP